MTYPRHLRTKLRRLFHLRRLHEHHYASRIHPISLTICKASEDVNIVKATCDWCMQPFLMPDKIRTIPIALPSDDFRLDIGGFCWKCREFRCHNGSIWVDGEFDEKGKVLFRTWACDTCRTPYTMDSVAAVAQFAQRKEFVEQLAKVIMKHSKGREH